MGKSPNSGRSRHFLYLYRDTQQRPRYVGYGRSPSRAFELRGRNEEFGAFVKKDRYTVEICGPFRTRELALAAETALISAERPDCNRSPGETQWRFRPLGVPEGFADRLAEPSLTRADLRRQSGASPVLLVRINDKAFDDGRPGYDPMDPPKDRHILGRMERWWQLGGKLAEWRLDPRRSPRLLVGVHGAPGSQIIIGAVRIDPEGWGKVQTKYGLWSVPTLPTRNLDACRLRDRRIRQSANIRFGQFFSRQYVLLPRPA